MILSRRFNASEPVAFSLEGIGGQFYLAPFVIPVKTKPIDLMLSPSYSFTAPECLIASANFAISASQNFPNSAAPMKRTVSPAFS